MSSSDSSSRTPPLPALPEPWRVKMVEPIVLRDREHRERCLREAAFNYAFILWQLGVEKVETP